MNYNQEVEKLNKGNNVWKPSAGVYDFVVLSEPEETEYRDDEGNVTPQIKLFIEMNNEQVVWYVPKGATTQSAFGQLMVIGKHYQQLTGQKLQLIVGESKDKGGKSRKNYTFPEAARIIQTNGKPQTIDMRE